MKKFTLFFVIAAVFAAKTSVGQLVTVGGATHAFLQGRYVEIGMYKSGSFRSSGVPAGYHPHTVGGGTTELAEVYDVGHDGWAVGTPPYMGDYTDCGSPEEAWRIEVNGTTWLADYGTSIITGAITGYSNVGGTAKAIWTGTVSGGQLAIKMETSVDTNASHVMMKVKLKNTGTTPLVNIYYSRDCDPDNTSTWPMGTPVTNNTIVYQEDVYGRAFINASTTSPASDLGLGTQDSRARVARLSGLSISGTLAALHASAVPPTYAAGTSTYTDQGIALVFKIGTLAAGDSTSFSYAYIFNGVAGFDTVFLPPCSGMPVAGIVNANTNTACSTTPVALSLSGTSFVTGLAYQWQSSPDSAAWSNVSAATASSYSFSGLTATTYYRCGVTCTTSAMTAYSPGKKITYTTTCPCTGTPTGGTATASTPFCSSCTLVLNLTGASSIVGITYQWEQSLNGTTWTNIVGATTVPYSSAPTAPAYYRCKVTCGVSGLWAYSSSVLVTTPSYIVDDSVRLSPDTACSGQLFFVKTSNSSPLLSVKTYFGDGTSYTSSPLTVSGSNSYTNVAHTYTSSGSYTVKQVLYCGTMAHDSISFTYTHVNCNILPLKFYIDDNSNCIKESTENFSYHPVLLRVDSSGVPVDTISVLSGIYYKIQSPPGTIYAFTMIAGSMYITCPSTGVILDTVVSGSYIHPTKYIAVYCTSTAFDHTQYVTFVADRRVGVATILSRNLLCSPTDASQAIYYSPKYKYGVVTSYSYSSPTPFSYTDNMATWNRTGLTCASTSAMISTRAYKATSADLTIGDTVYTSFMIGPTTGDDNPGNNVIVRNDTIRAAYDPNLIEVNPGCFDNDTTLQFTVHFENLGNDTAHNVYVLDTISSNLDWRSLELLATSDVMDIYPFEQGGYKIIKFDFPNINLLDSSQHGFNDGMFVYKIKTRVGMVTGESILSRVGIYFDDNEVVMTNTVENKKGCPLPITMGVNNSYRHNIFIYPNPATDELTIKTEQGAFTSFTISNTMGQQLMGMDMSSGATAKVSVRALPSGVYYVTLRGAQGNEVRKFVKW